MIKHNGKEDTGMKESTFSRKKFIAVSITFFLLIAFAAGYYVLSSYHVRTVTVEGNAHYTDEQIKEMILPGGIWDNSILLSVKYSKKKMRDIPFVEAMDVEVVSKNEICIRVYEKKLAGCVRYLGSYLYFDREGIVVETSQELTDGVPVIKGLSFDHIVMHEKIPVEQETIFGEILKVTQLLAKYELGADEIYFKANGEVTLLFGQARILLGTDENIDEKVEQLAYILPNLEGRVGTLHLENYNETTTKINFEPES